LQANAAIVHAQSAFDAQNTTGNYANSAFIQANAGIYHAQSAYNTANAGFIQANASIVHAQSAYDAANAGFIQANAGIYHAQSAYNTANAGFIQANAAILHAQSSYDTANAGFIQANISILHAQSAFHHANAGYVAANVADGKAVTAGDYANAAFIVANATTIQANSAFDHANSGFIQANSAFFHANSGFIQANASYNQANAVFIVANATTVQANAAFDTANAAFLAANNALDTWVRGQANAAFDKANSAGIAANTPSTKANSAFFHANAAYNHANAAFIKANTGGGGGGGTANAEVQSFTTIADGISSTYTLSYLPISNASVIVSIGGIVQTENVDYVVAASNSTISFTEPPPDGERIRVAGFANVTPYFFDAANSAGAIVNAFNGVGDGANTTFALGFQPATDISVFVTIGGIVQPESAYTTSNVSNTITFGTAPGDGENIRVVGFTKINPYYVQYVSSNVTVSVFEETANGNTASFNLGFNPQLREALTVTIDGIVQPISAYTINTTANTITFDANPANGELVRVATFYTTVNPYSLSANTVTFEQLQPSLRSYINTSFDTANTANTVAQAAATTGKAIAMSIVFGG
jgi:hypothetical protein